jgi:endonuclease/exonuclease/phosphatase family metal-dependent hydrolase
VTPRLLPLILAAALAAASPVPVFTEPISPVTIKVLTYNLGLLRVLGSDLVPLVEARARLAPTVLADFARENAPAIILLEEVWNDRHADAIAKEAAPLGYAAVQPKIHSIVGLNSGLLLLVRTPLRVTDWKFTPFSKTTFSDSFARKGVLEATLQDAETGLQFVLVGTHTVALDTVRGQPRDQAQEDAIKAQMEQILQTLRRRSEKGRIPALLLGDFNVGPGYADAIYRIIAEAEGLREAGASLPSGSPFITWDPANPLVKFGKYPDEPAAKIDHLFLVNGESGTWEPVHARRVFTSPLNGLSITSPGGASVPAPLSDHYGFFTELIFHPSS